MGQKQSGAKKSLESWDLAKILELTILRFNLPIGGSFGPFF
jgi:hypothetical protein